MMMMMYRRGIAFAMAPIIVTHLGAHSPFSKELYSPRSSLSKELYSPRSSLSEELYSPRSFTPTIADYTDTTTEQPTNF